MIRQSQIGWNGSLIPKPTEVTSYTTVDQWSVDFVYKQIPILMISHGTLRDLFINKGHASLTENFSTDSGAYGSYTIGHSVGPLVLTLFIDK